MTTSCSEPSQPEQRKIMGGVPVLAPVHDSLHHKDTLQLTVTPPPDVIMVQPSPDQFTTTGFCVMEPEPSVPASLKNSPHTIPDSIMQLPDTISKTK